MRRVGVEREVSPRLALGLHMTDCDVAALLREDAHSESAVGGVVLDCHALAAVEEHAGGVASASHQDDVVADDRSVALRLASQRVHIALVRDYLPEVIGAHPEVADPVAELMLIRFCLDEAVEIADLVPSADAESALRSGRGRELLSRLNPEREGVALGLGDLAVDREGLGIREREVLKRQILAVVGDDRVDDALHHELASVRVYREVLHIGEQERDPLEAVDAVVRRAVDSLRREVRVDLIDSAVELERLLTVSFAVLERAADVVGVIGGFVEIRVVHVVFSFIFNCHPDFPSL